MDAKSRPSDLDELGHIPWGSHFCLFYETKEDLLEVALPYFKQGLEGREHSCFPPGMAVCRHILVGLYGSARGQNGVYVRPDWK